MKRVLTIATLLTLALAASAQAQTFGVTVRTQNAGAPVERMKVETGVAVGQVQFLNSFIQVNAIAAPAVSGAGTGRIFFDTATNKFRASENGGAYVDLVGGAGGAPTGAQYITAALDATLTAERVLTQGPGITVAFGAGTATVSTNLAANDGVTNEAGDLVNWNEITNMPAGFADNTDNDTTYAAGNQTTIGGGNTIDVTEGAGSGLDADLLDALTSTDFVRSTGSVAQSVTGVKTFADAPIVGDGAGTDRLSFSATSGVLQVGTFTAAAPTAGDMRYNAGNLEYHNGVAWQALGVGGAGVTTFNGLSGAVTTTAGAGLTQTVAGNDTTFNVGTGPGITVNADTIQTNLAADDTITNEAGDLVNWNEITNMPAGFADNVDNDTTYLPGNQLTIAGSTFDVVEGAGSDLDADLLDGIDSAGFVRLGPAAMQTEGTANPMIWLNETAAGGNMVELWKSGAIKFSISNAANSISFWDTAPGSDKTIRAQLNRLVLEADTSVQVMLDWDDTSANSVFGVRADNDSFDLFTVSETGTTTLIGTTLPAVPVQAELRFRELTTNGTDYVAMLAPAALAASYTLTLPADDGTPGQLLSTNGAGTLSWSSPGGNTLDQSYDQGGAGVGRTITADSGSVLIQGAAAVGENLFQIKENSGAAQDMMLVNDTTGVNFNLVGLAGNAKVAISSNVNSLPLFALDVDANLFTGAFVGDMGGARIDADNQNAAAAGAARSGLYVNLQSAVANSATSVFSGLKVTSTGIAGSTDRRALDISGTWDSLIRTPTFRVSGAGVVTVGSLAVDPAGVNGQMYYDSGTNKFRAYENGAWVNMIGAGGGVTSLNGLSGVLTTTAGAGLTQSVAGSDTTFNIGAGPGITVNADSIQTDLAADDTITNEAGDLVNWNELTNMPAGFADNTDDEGNSFTIFELVGPNVVADSPTDTVTINGSGGALVNGDSGTDTITIGAAAPSGDADYIWNQNAFSQGIPSVFWISGAGRSDTGFEFYNQAEARFMENSGNGTDYVGFRAPASVGANLIWELPAADGAAGTVLSTNGVGVLSWVAAGGGGNADTLDLLDSTQFLRRDVADTFIGGTLGVDPGSKLSISANSAGTASTGLQNGSNCVEFPWGFIFSNSNWHMTYQTDGLSGDHHQFFVNTTQVMSIELDTLNLLGYVDLPDSAADPAPTLQGTDDASDIGSIYFNSGTNTLRVYNGAAWADVGGAGGGVASIDYGAGAQSGAVTLPTSGATNYIQNQGVATQAASFWVSGSGRIDTTLRMGSETGTSEAPFFPGLMMREMFTSNTGAGSIVAIASPVGTGSIQLQRDGTNGGFQVFNNNTGLTINVRGIAVSSTGTFYIATDIADNTTAAVIADANNIEWFEMTFGWPYGPTHHTTVTLTRTPADYFWVGEMTSTTNQ